MPDLHERPALLGAKIPKLQIKTLGLLMGRKPPKLSSAIGGRLQLGVMKGRPAAVAYPMTLPQRFSKCQRNLPETRFS